MPQPFGRTQGLLLSIGVVAVIVFPGTPSSCAGGRLDSTAQQVFDSMRGSFQPVKAKDVHARYQWYLSGPDGGAWWIDVNNGAYKMGKGTISNPNVTFIAAARDWVAISNGQLSGTWAYLTGRLKIRGNQQLARKLGEMFP